MEDKDERSDFQMKMEHLLRTVRGRLYLGATFFSLAGTILLGCIGGDPEGTPVPGGQLVFITPTAVPTATLTRGMYGDDGGSREPLPNPAPTAVTTPVS